MFQLFYRDASGKRIDVGKPYSNLNRCRTRKDKLDMEYGACRYLIWDNELGRTRC